MSANNIQRNVTSFKWYANGLGAAETITSVRDFIVEPNADFLEDGSDGDTSATFSETRRELNRLTLIARDPRELEKLVAEKGDANWTEGAARGAAKEFWCVNAVWARSYSHNGMWDELKEYRLQGQGGRKTAS